MKRWLGNEFTPSSTVVQPPRAVHGEWSNWSSWSACSRTCGVGLRTRERDCNQPAPEFGGHLCRGSAKEVSTCEVNRPGGSVACPGGVAPPTASDHSSWSSWSAWSTCERDCSQVEGTHPGRAGWQRRGRVCQMLVADSRRWDKAGGREVGAALQGHGCPGPAEEVQQCQPNPKLPKCASKTDSNCDCTTTCVNVIFHPHRQ